MERSRGLPGRDKGRRHLYGLASLRLFDPCSAPTPPSQLALPAVTAVADSELEDLRRELLKMEEQVVLLEQDLRAKAESLSTWEAVVERLEGCYAEQQEAADRRGSRPRGRRWRPTVRGLLRNGPWSQPMRRSGARTLRLR
jgi:hypothetical protein